MSTPLPTPTTAVRSVAVLGLGAMGLPMATRLSTGLQVRGYDIAPERLALAGAQGVVPCATAVEAVTGADALLLAVRDGAQLEEVLFGAAGVAGSLRAGAVVLLTSTVGTQAVLGVVERLEALGVDVVDAPLSGGPARAGAGDLLVVVGATPRARAPPPPSWSCSPRRSPWSATGPVTARPSRR